MKRQTPGYAIRSFLLGTALWFGLAEVLPAQTTFTLLKSMGFPQASTAANPYSWLVESGGKLFGTAYAAGSNGLGGVFRVNKDGSGYTLLHTFAPGASDGANPQAGLLVGRDGALYGTCSRGGTNGMGVVFKLNTDGSGYKVVHSMGSLISDATQPYAGLIQAQDNLLYGVGLSGGTNGDGAIYRLDTNGGSYAIVFSLGDASDGMFQCYGNLMQGRDGVLYAVARGGGTNGYGGAFRVGTNGSGFQILHEFSSPSDGGYPMGGLLQAQDGALYGTTSDGGTNGYGTIYRMKTNGANFGILHACSYTPDAFNILGALIQGTNGMLYGTSEYGGGGNYGALYEVSTDGVTYAVIHDIGGYQFYGQHPQAALFQSGDGLLYGTTRDGGTNGNGTVFSLTSDGNNYTEFFNFNGNGSDANNAAASLLVGKDGALYGTSYYGGTNGVGTIFKLNRDGTGYQILHHFGAGNDGSYPYAGLVQTANGTLFGSTSTGGTNGNGTIFSIGTNGQSYVVLVAPEYQDGFAFNGTPIIGMDGGLYGTGNYGGTNFDGVVYRVNQNGQNYTVLHSFPVDATDGMNPQSSLIQGPDGTLYGTTYDGGTNSNGTVFRMSTNGGGFMVLHHFPAFANDGASPYGALAQGPDGTLYGTTYGGTTNYGGSVFKMSTNGGAYVVIHVFTYSDGGYPYGNLGWAGDGLLMGTTLRGGDSGNGTVFTIDTNGNNLVTLHSFVGAPLDGSLPQGGVVSGNDGGIYGATTTGGSLDYGSVYKLTSTADIARLQYFGHTGAVVTVSSFPGQMYHLQATTNLGKAGWTNLATNVIGASGISVVTDPDATNRAAKFYRTTTP